MKHCLTILMVSLFVSVFLVACNPSRKPEGDALQKAHALCGALNVIEKDFGNLTYSVDADVLDALEGVCPKAARSIRVRSSEVKPASQYRVSFNAAGVLEGDALMTVHFYQSPEGAYAVLVRLHRSKGQWTVVSAELLSVS